MDTTSHPLLPANQHNLFGFQPESESNFSAQPGAARLQLATLGFSIRQSEPAHWLVTHRTAAAELHFYSEWELAQFASHRATRYAGPQPSESTS